MIIEAIKAWMATPVPYAFPISIGINLFLMACFKTNRNILKELSAVPLLAVFVVTLPFVGVAVLISKLSDKEFGDMSTTMVVRSVSWVLRKVGLV